MEIGRIEAVLSARFDKDPFVKYDKALDKSEKAARKGATAKLDVKADTRGTDKMQRGLKDTERQADRTTRSMRSGFGSMGKSAIKGAVGVGALFAAYRLAKGAVTDTVELAKASMGLSRVTGMELNQASQLISITKVRGVETQKLTMSFTVLSKQMEAANKGSESATAAFKALGVSQATLKTGDTTQAFKEAADGLAGMENGSKKTALASQLFGRGYQALFPILDLGSKGIQEQLDLAAKMGAELGTNNPKEIKKGLEAQRTMKLALIGLNVVLGKELIPLLTDAATFVAEFAKEWRDGKGAGNDAKEVFQKIWDVLDKLTQPLRDHPRLIGLLAGAYVAFKTTVGALKLMSLFMNTLGTPKDYAAAGAARGKAFGIAFQLAAVAGLGYFLYEQAKAGVDLVRGKVKDLNIFPALGPMVGKWVSGIIDPVGSEAGNFGERIKKGWLGTAFSDTWRWIKTGASDTWKKISGVFGGGEGKLAAIRAPNLQGFYKMGQEVGRWMREAAERVGDFASRAYTNGKKWAQRAIDGVGDWLGRLPDKVRGWFDDGVSAIGRLVSNAWSSGKNFGRNIVSGIISGIKSLPGAVSNAVRSLLPSALLRKVGSLLGFASGGRVGPTAGGAQLFIAGEGGKDEWVISQEGDRRQNIGYAMQALETLTGKPIQGFAAGKGIKKFNALSGQQETHTKAQWEKIVTSYSTFAKSMAGYSNDTAGDTEEERAWAVAQFSGAEDTAISNAMSTWGGLGLTGIQGALFNQLRGLLGQYAGMKGAYDGKRREARTANWPKRITALRDLPGRVSDLSSKRDELGGVYQQLNELINPAPLFNGGGEPPPPEPPAPPAPSIEERVADELAKFTSARRNAITAFSSNFSLGAVGYQPGVAMSGGATSGAVAASGAQVRIVNNYQAPPEDPHSWSAGLAYELKAAL